MIELLPGSYRPVAQLGAGGFGVVWEVERLSDGLTCVLKMPKQPYSDDELHRFGREVRLQSQLEHRYIVPILDFNLTNDPPWFVMPKASMNFAEALRRLQLDQAVEIFLDVVTGIAYAHQNRVIHRDLKPANILLFEDNAETRYRPAVSDFGLGRPFTRDTPWVTSTGVGIGSPWFAAPEQWQDFRQADASADVFALGRILQLILSPNGDRIQTEYRRLEYCIRRATAEQPSERHSNADELLADLRLLIEEPQALQRPEDAALRMVQGILAGGTFGPDEVRPLVRVLFENRDDYRLLVGLLPRLPSPLLAGLFAADEAAMADVLVEYDVYLQEPLAVAYAQAAVHVLENVYIASEETRIRVIALKRIIALAATYDLWESGYIIARIIGDEQDPQALIAVGRMLNQTPTLVEWCRPFLRNVSLPPLVRQALNG